MKIFKYPVLIEDESTIILPYGAQILSVVNQHDNIFIYALIDTPENVSKKKITVRVIGTGNEMPADSYLFEFLGTVPHLGGRYMWHVFYREGGKV
jgi:hypothetical protein